MRTCQGQTLSARVVGVLGLCLLVGAAACGGGGGADGDTGKDAGGDVAGFDATVGDVEGPDVQVSPDAVGPGGDAEVEVTPEVVREVLVEVADEPELVGPASLTLLGFKLPEPVAGIAAVADDDGAAYIFGGDAGGAPVAEVVRFVPDEGAEIVAGAVLPQPVKAASAIWTGDAYGAFVFGGMTAAGMTDAIQNCDLTSPFCTLLDVKLPSKRALTAAFFDGLYAYVLGGNMGQAGLSDQIVRFDPDTAEVKVLPEKLPTPRASRIGAVWSGDGMAFFLGGLIAGGKTGEILEYDPTAGTVVDSGMDLPLPMDGGAYAWLGAAVMVFGGETTLSTTDSVLVVSPNTVEVTVSDLKLPSARRGGAAVVLNSNIYIFGGTGLNGLLDEIVRYRPPGD